MAELKNMTVQALRELARKALGRGHSRLKTKGELVAALQAASKNVSDAAGKAVSGAGRAAARVKAATGRAAKAAEQVVESATRGRAAAKAKRAGKAAAKKEAATARKETAAGRKKEAAGRKEPAARKRAAAPAAPPPEPQRDEPDADGYFVARVRGEDAVRDAPHPMTESALEEVRAAPGEPRRAAHRAERAHEEDLGELPWTYDDDALVALPRDPRTLFVYWDHQDDTLRGGFEGLDGGKAQLWIFARNDAGGWDRVRVLDFALESRSYYVHDLDAGRIYRAEIHVVDRAGRSRRLQDPSNEMTLPPFGPSPVIDDRFMRLPWSEPLTRLLRHVREGAPFPDELRALLANLSDWSRFVAPTWGGGGTSGAGGPGGRPGGPGGPSGGPSSPSSPWGPYGGRSGEGR
jgi:hypothetical protein